MSARGPSYETNGEIAAGDRLPAGVQRVALAVEYNGAAFHGWQVQKNPDIPTVQGALEKALSVVANQPIKVICAGRTDAGVHGTNQVVHFDTTADRPARSWVLGANANLADTVAVRWAKPVSATFHARFSALSRVYRYVIYNGATRPAMSAKELTWDFRQFDVERMQVAANYLVGEHDFTSFRAAGCQAKSPIRQVDYIQFKRLGDLILFEVKANAFLQHMVRNFAGALMAVGAGKQRPAWINDVLAAKDRRLAGITAPPHGLYLVKVFYDPAYNLPSCPFGPHFLSYLSID